MDGLGAKWGMFLLAGATVCASLGLSAGFRADGADASLKGIHLGSHLAGDGRRFVSFQRPDGAPVILDARTGKVRKIRRAKGCSPADVGFGRVLLDCTRGYYYDFKKPRIASVWTGRSRPIPGSRKSETYDLGEIGKYWVRADCDSGSPCYSVIYRNFRTGRSRAYDTVGNSADIAPPGLSVYDFDLDNRHLGRFKPHPDFSIFTSDFNWGTYAGFGPHYYLINDLDGLRLVRNLDHSIRIGGFIRNADGIFYHGMSRGSGRLIWTNGKWLRAYDLKSGRRVLRKLGRPGASATVVRQGAVVAIPAERVNKARRYRIRIVRF